VRSSITTTSNSRSTGRIETVVMIVRLVVSTQALAGTGLAG
jgi:hypothetical protein